MPNPKTVASSAKIQQNAELEELMNATVKLWGKHHLTYDQGGYIGKEVRRQLKSRVPVSIAAKATPALAIARRSNCVGS